MRILGKKERVGADLCVRPCFEQDRRAKKALCQVRDRGLFAVHFTSSMMAVSAASPRRTPVRTMRV